ncbi:MAG TPA: sterol desaturase family protein [Ramlibacter sp.]|nr:sterol desaturase family protein [Ramlibacter sp.]
MPGWVVAALLGTVFLGLLLVERRRPLRRRTAPAGQRLVGNVATGAVAALAVALPNLLVTRPATALVERRQWGVLPRLGLPPAAERGAALVLMDYTLYLWHILLHRMPFLWRWHRVHHADPDLDVSTALRFHAAELAWSVPWRAAQVLLIGVPRRTLALWGSLTLAEVMFHHANLRLPRALERVLGWFVVTPRAHGVHHDSVAAHQHGNFSSGLAAWDHLHGTRAADIPQEAIVIGLPAPDGQRTGSPNP